MNKHDTISLQYSQRHLRNVKSIVHATQRLMLLRSTIKLSIQKEHFSVEYFGVKNNSAIYCRDILITLRETIFETVW